MIALAKDHNTDSLHAKFSDMLPSIRSQLEFAFRHERREQRRELVAEALANCWAAFLKLAERGAYDVIFATPLAQFAVKQVRSGRRVGGRLNKNDTSSGYAQRARNFTVKRLDCYDTQRETWHEALVEDKTAGPAEIAATRIDFGDWLDSLGAKQREITEALASGETTSAVAKTFQVSCGRISQLRRQLYDDWRRFQGEPDEKGSLYRAHENTSRRARCH